MVVVKTIFYLEDKAFALISSNERGCFFASIIFLENGEEFLEVNVFLKTQVIMILMVWEVVMFI